MIPVTTETVRLFLHVLAATVWVGGQLLLAALLPTLRRLGPDVPGQVARAFARVAWPAFGVLLLTRAWNISAEDRGWSGDNGPTLEAKLAVVALSGLSAALHTKARTAGLRAITGAGTGLFAVLALLLGILLAG